MALKSDAHGSQWLGCPTGDSHLLLCASRELYERWGGRPRYVLEKALDQAAQTLLEEALGSSDLLDIVKSWAEQRGKRTASDRCARLPNLNGCAMQRHKCIKGAHACSTLSSNTLSSALRLGSSSWGC
jgi:hypothetical protein